MIDVLTKPADQIGVSDIKALIDSRVPESDRIEFKQDLSTEQGAPDKWMSGANDIGKQARDKILKEAVAFANAYGGALLLGIKESRAKPPVAAEISPIPRCADLADRLKHVFRDCVEPQLPRLDIVSVRIEDDGGGVVVIRVGRSRLAPHTVRPTRVCPIRRQDRCEKMTMREIQDIRLNVSRGLERLDKRFSERSERFQREFKCLRDPENAFGIRATAMPVGEDVRIDRVFRGYNVAEEFDVPWRRVLCGNGADRKVLEESAFIPQCWRPLPRGARAEYGPDPDDTDRFYHSYLEIHCDGLVELGLTSCVTVPSDSRYLSLLPDWPVIMFANLIVRAHNMRDRVGVPSAEYAADVDIHARGRDVLVAAHPVHPVLQSSLPKFQPPGLPRFSGYELGDSGGVPGLLGLFMRDFWNSLGVVPGVEGKPMTIEGWPADL